MIGGYRNYWDLKKKENTTKSAVPTSPKECSNVFSRNRYPLRHAALILTTEIKDY